MSLFQTRSDGLKKLAIRATLKSLGMKVPKKIDDEDWGITYDETLELWRQAHDTLMQLPPGDQARAYFEKSRGGLFHLAKLLHKPATPEEAAYLVYHITIPYSIEQATRKLIVQICQDVNALHWDHKSNKCLAYREVLIQPTESTKINELAEWVTIIPPMALVERIPKELVGIEYRAMG